MNKLYNLNVTYGRVPSDLLNSDQLTLKAKGLYAYIENKPKGWRFSSERIAKEIKDGIKAIQSGLNELEQAGYLTRVRQRDAENNQFTIYYLHSQPTIQDAYDIKEESMSEDQEEPPQNDEEHTPKGHTPKGHTPKGHTPKGHTPKGHTLYIYSINKHNKDKHTKNKHIFGTEESAPEIAQSSKEIVKKKPTDEVAKVYYETIKTLKLPVRNHNNVRTKINQLKQELGEEDSLKYLQFIIDIYPTLPDDGFKPRILESLDIYSKRVAIGSWVTNLRDKQSGGIAGW